MSSSRALRIGALIALFALPCVVLMYAPHHATTSDPDIWWHLRTGEWILQHHAVPRTDMFSRTAMGRPWAAYSWLFEVIVAALFNRFGLLGLVLYNAIMRTAVAVALYRLVRGLEPHFWKAWGLTLLGLLVMLDVFGPRPGMFTVLLFVVQLHILSTARRSGNCRLLLLLPPMYVLWANTHIQFIYGLAVLVLFGIEAWVRRIHPALDAAPVRPIAAARIWPVIAGCVLATFLNPYSARIYGVVYGLSTQAGPYQYISELHAPDFRLPYDWFQLAIVALAFLVVGLRRKFDPLAVILLIAATAFGMRAVRDSWFTAAAGLWVIASGDAKAGEGDVRGGLRVNQGIVAAGVVLVIAAAALAFHVSNRQLEKAVAEDYPAKAVRFIREHKLQGPLYNDFDWGGYLVWALPELPVYVDGRTNLYGDEFLLRHFSVRAGAHDWALDNDLASSKVVLSNLEHPLTSLLRLDPRFEAVYEDTHAVVFQAR